MDTITKGSVIGHDDLWNLPMGSIVVVRGKGYTLDSLSGWEYGDGYTVMKAWPTGSAGKSRRVRVGKSTRVEVMRVNSPQRVTIF